MKLIFALLALLVALACAARVVNFIRIIRLCAEENQVKMPEFRAALNNTAPVPPKVGCVYACVATKMRFMKEDGSINRENIRAWIGIKKRFGNMITNCSTEIAAGEKCVNGQRLLDCLRNRPLRGLERFGLGSGSSPAVRSSAKTSRRTRRVSRYRSLLRAVRSGTISGFFFYVVFSLFQWLFPQNQTPNLPTEPVQ